MWITLTKFILIEVNENGLAAIAIIAIYNSLPIIISVKLH